MDRYQKRPLKFSGYGRELRSDARNKERRTSRSERYSTSRPLGTNNETLVLPVAPNASRIPVCGLKKPSVSREEMLKKWKEEKLKKKQMEAMTKKPAFKPVSLKLAVAVISSTALSSNSSASNTSRVSQKSSIRVPEKISKLPSVASKVPPKVPHAQKQVLPKVTEKFSRLPTAKAKPVSHTETTKVEAPSKEPKTIPKPVSKIPSTRNDRTVARRIVKPTQVPTVKVFKPPVSRPAARPKADTSSKVNSKDSTFLIDETYTEQRTIRQSFAPEEFQFSFSLPMDDPAQMFLDLADGRRSTPRKPGDTIAVTPNKQHTGSTTTELPGEKSNADLTFAIALSISKENVNCNINIQRSPVSDSASQEAQTDKRNEDNNSAQATTVTIETDSAYQSKSSDMSPEKTKAIAQRSVHFVEAEKSVGGTDESIGEVTLGVKSLTFKPLPKPVFASRSSSECSAFGRTLFRSQLDSIVETRETPEITPRSRKKTLPEGFTPRRSSRLSALREKENQLSPSRLVFDAPTPRKSLSADTLNEPALTAETPGKFVASRRSTRLSKLYSQSYEDLFDIEEPIYTSPEYETDYSIKKSIADTPQQKSFASSNRVSLLYTPPRRGRTSVLQPVDKAGNLMAFSPDVTNSRSPKT